jgi:SAM-dependent methyltransferase
MVDGFSMSLSLQEKYSQAAVVAFWTRFAASGLQLAEARMLERYTPPPPARILDIGCGAGRVTVALAPCGYAVDGVDITAAMVQAANSLAALKGVRGAFVQADLCALPVAACTYDIALIFIAALQHVPGRALRQDALRQIARALRQGGVLVLALDNLAPALRCYIEWGAGKLRGTVDRSGRTAGAARQTADGRRLSDPGSTDSHRNVPSAVASSADIVLASNQSHMSRLRWHARGLQRTLRWRMWEGVRDAGRRLRVAHGEPGDTRIDQVSMPRTDGTVYYHLYQHDELVADAKMAGLRLLGYHSGNELAQDVVFGETARRLDKQVMYAFCND